MIGPKERQLIETTSLQALSGAESVKKKLLNALALQTPSIEDRAYLIKCRVKDHTRLVEKIIDRRERGIKSDLGGDYSAEDVTDLVGLRLLVLYGNKLPLMVEHFLSFVRWTQDTSINLFIGDRLQTLVKEVIIYQSKTSDESINSSVIEKFRRANLVPDAPNENFRVEPKPSDYSSIHMVLWCRGLDPSGRYKVPLEVQIRTALEDVWGEMDHSLKYKGQKRNEDTFTREQNIIYESAVGRLKNLKHHLDVCSEDADNIEADVAKAFDRPYIESGYTDAESVDLHKLETLGLKPSLQDKLNENVKKERQLFDRLFERDGLPKKMPSYTQLIKGFEDVTKTLDECFEEYCSDPFKECERNSDARYYLQMETALCWYWQGKLIHAGLSSADRGIEPELPVDRHGCLTEAVRRYTKIEEEHPYDPMLCFRKAKVYGLEGHLEMAFDYYRRAVENLERSDRLPAGHFMRNKIPWQYCIAAWERGEALKSDAEERGDDNLHKTERQKHYLEAFRTMKRMYEMSPHEEESPTISETDSAELGAEQTRITGKMIPANNLLEYASCYIRAGGSEETLQREGYGESDFKQMLNEVLENGVDAIERPTIADTVRAVADELIHDDDLIEAAAQRVLDLLDERDWSIKYNKRVIDEMRRDAEAALRKLAEKGAATSGGTN